MADVFIAHLEWSGAARGPTLESSSYSRDLDLTAGGHTIPMSAARRFRGDPTRVNPEQLFVASLSACQALTYLHLAATHQIAVVRYVDDAEGQLTLVAGKLRMTRATLRPRITLEAGTDRDKARDLVDRAHQECFIANSVMTDVVIEPVIDVIGD